MNRNDKQTNIRIPPEMKAQLAASAVRANRTMGAEVVHRLAQTLGDAEIDDAHAAGCNSLVAGTIYREYVTSSEYAAKHAPKVLAQTLEMCFALSALRSAARYLDPQHFPEAVASVDAALAKAGDDAGQEALSESDKDVALAQAVALAEYVVGAAKGSMVERARHFLSAPYAQEISARLAASPDWAPTFLDGRQRCGEWLGAWPPVDGDDWVIEVAHRDMFGKWTRVAPGEPQHVMPPAYVKPLPPPPPIAPK